MLPSPSPTQTQSAPRPSSDSSMEGGRVSLSGAQPTVRRQWAGLLRQYLPGFTFIDVPLLDALDMPGYALHVHLMDEGQPDPGDVVLYHFETGSQRVPVLVLSPGGTEPAWAGSQLFLEWRLCDPEQPGSVAAAARRLILLHRQAAQLSKVTRQLSDSEHEFEEFAHWVGHDISGPIRLAGKFAELIERELDAEANPRIAEYLEYVIGNYHQAHRMIGDLRALSQLRRFTDSLALVHLEELLQDLGEEFAPRLEECRGHLQIGELPTVAASLAQLRTLFEALLDNAIRYRSERPLGISVDASRDDQRWIITVTDNGTGMSPGVMQNAFEPFHRGHPHIAAGTGVGLAFARRIAILHGGSVWLESREDHGTTVYVALPAARPKVV